MSEPVAPAEGDAEPQAVDAIQGANPFIELTPRQMVQALGRWGPHRSGGRPCSPPES